MTLLPHPNPLPSKVPLSSLPETIRLLKKQKENVIFHALGTSRLLAVRTRYTSETTLFLFPISPCIENS